MGKWDRAVGKTGFIKKRFERLQHNPFVHDMIENTDIKTILEIGGGEIIEAQAIKVMRPDIRYTIIDIAEAYVKNAKKRGFNAICADIEKVELTEKYDMVYANSVLEHVKNVAVVIDKILKIAKRYHIVLFKWKFKKGDLKPFWCAKKGYYSNTYAIKSLFPLFNDTIKEIYVTDWDNNKIDWGEYQHKMHSCNLNRNGNYLHLVGETDGN